MGCTFLKKNYHTEMYVSKRQEVIFEKIQINLMKLVIFDPHLVLNKFRREGKIDMKQLVQTVLFYHVVNILWFITIKTSVTIVQKMAICFLLAKSLFSYVDKSKYSTP